MARVAHTQQYIKKSAVTATAVTGGREMEVMNMWGSVAANTVKQLKVVSGFPKGTFRIRNRMPSSCFVCS